MDVMPIGVISQAGRFRRLKLPAVALAAAVTLMLAPSAALANDAGLTVVKVPDSIGTVAGGSVGYRIVVQINPSSGDDSRCLAITATSMQCPANNVIVTDVLPTNPLGLDWTIDARGSDPGCNIGFTTPGSLTCSWGSLTAPSQSKTVHIMSTTTASTCGTIVNQDVHVTYNWADGTAQFADATNSQVVVACPAPTATPSVGLTPSPAPLPAGSVRGATSPPRPHITLPPTDAAPESSVGSTTSGLPVNLLIFAASAISSLLVALRRKSTAR